jgi:hypothetical protein
VSKAIPDEIIEAIKKASSGLNGISLKVAWTIYVYKEQSSERIPMNKFREELKTHFSEFHDRAVIDGLQVRNYFVGPKRSSL